MSGSSSLSALEALSVALSSARARTPPDLQERTAHDLNQRLRVLLDKVKAEEQSLSPTARQALEEAHAVANGLDPYLERISTPHPDILVRPCSVLACLLELTL